MVLQNTLSDCEDLPEISDIVFTMRNTFYTILIITLFIGGCQTDPSDKYVPKGLKNKEKYATPEPGTYLKPVAYSILKKINQVIEEPESYKKPADWMFKMLSAPQKKIVDTLLQIMDSKVPVRIYYPSKNSLKGNHPVVLFFHGGGFIMGSVEEYHMMVSKLAKVTGHIFISVDYRLAPEYPFPAGVNDCYGCLRWVQENGSDIGADTTRIIVMGDSAGGNLATVLTLLCRDNHMPQPVCQVLIYPGVTFVDREFPSRDLFGRCTDMTYVLDESFLRMVKTQYMGEESNDIHPYLSPLEAELTGELAPVLIITAECDPIRDDGRIYVEKLRTAGVEVIHYEYSGMIHGFLSFHMILGDALQAMKEIRDYLERI